MAEVVPVITVIDDTEIGIPVIVRVTQVYYLDYKRGFNKMVTVIVTVILTNIITNKPGIGNW